MEYLYYIQGVHPVRVELDRQGEWDEVERYDPKKQDFVSDWRMVKRINDDMDCKKVSPLLFWEYIALLKANRPMRKGKSNLTRQDYKYYIQGVFAVYVRYDSNGKPMYCKRSDLFEKGLKDYKINLAELDNTSIFTKVNCNTFWSFVAESGKNLFSVN